MKKNCALRNITIAGLCAILLATSTSYPAEQKNFRDEAQFSIYLAGKEIGREKFSVQSNGESIRSNSTLSFRDPSGPGQSVKMETELTMNGRFVPTLYILRTDVNGQKGIVRGQFIDAQATFEYAASGGTPSKSRLLVGEQYTVLDTNVFHHFTFLARLFDFSSNEKMQAMEVVIPQELRNGLLKISDIGLEKVSVRGKNRDLHHLKADSGSVQVDLWVDDQHVLHKLALPLKRIEVIRD